jgi:flagellar hook-length control protein FliK
MTMQSVLPLTPSNSAPPTSGAPPGPAPPGAPPFHGTLVEHWARTADAEGQQQISPKADRDRVSHEHPKRRGDERGAHAVAGRSPGTVATEPTFAPAPTGGAVPTPPVGAVSTTSTPETATDAVTTIAAGGDDRPQLDAALAPGSTPTGPTPGSAEQRASIGDRAPAPTPAALSADPPTGIAMEPSAETTSNASPNAGPATSTGTGGEGALAAEPSSSQVVGELVGQAAAQTTGAGPAAVIVQAPTGQGPAVSGTLPALPTVQAPAATPGSTAALMLEAASVPGATPVGTAALGPEAASVPGATPVGTAALGPEAASGPGVTPVGTATLGPEAASGPGVTPGGIPASVMEAASGPAPISGNTAALVSQAASGPVATPGSTAALVSQAAAGPPIGPALVATQAPVAGQTPVASQTPVTGQSPVAIVGALEGVRTSTISADAGGTGGQGTSTGSGLAAGMEAGEGSNATTTAGEELDSVLEPIAQIELAGVPAPSQEGSLAGSSVDLRQIIESIHATVELAARQGSARARIVLEPEELGHMSIHLSQTDEGLLVRVTADTSVAAQALAESHAELRHSLSSLGVSLLGLDVGSSAGREAGERSGGHADQSSLAAPTSSAPEQGEDLETVPLPAGLARGELVDVLA